jgi:5-formyltetrahydrofolate cyclo-ligase
MNGPGTPPTDLKGALREELRRRLRALSPEERGESSRLIRNACVGLPEWSRARVTGLFHPRSDEPDIWPLVEVAWAAGKTVTLPAYDAVRSVYRWSRVRGPQDLAPGRYGIAEPRAHCDPVDAESLDLALVPGLGFSTDGGRLGRGRGFYDRLLVSFRGKGLGVAFDFQVLPQIPREDHDVRLDGVITPSGCRFAPTGAT